MKTISIAATVSGVLLFDAVVKVGVFIDEEVVNRAWSFGQHYTGKKCNRRE